MFSFKQWLRHRKNMIAGSSPRRRKQHPWRLEQLEDRTVPTGLYVDPTYAGQIGSVATFDNQGAVIGTTAFSTLSAAIQQANPGDVINVDGGTYMENVTLNQKVTLSETGVALNAGIFVPNSVVDLDGSLTQSAGVLTDNGLGGQWTVEGGATQTAGTIAVRNVQLGGDGNGNFAFASPTNTIGSLTATNTGAITLSNASALTLAGVTTVTGDVFISSAGSLTVSAVLSGAGNVTLQGSGGTGSEAGVDGVLLLSGVTAGGDLTIMGTGGSGNGSNDAGVVVERSFVTAGGNLNITGIGGTGEGGNNDGVTIEGGGQVAVDGSGSVTVTGNGGGNPNDTVGQNDGVYVTGVSAPAAVERIVGGQLVVQIFVSPSLIAATDGLVSVKGTGGSGTGGSNSGVVVDLGGEIASNGDGAVTVQGLGGGTASGGGNYGVYVNGETISRKFVSNQTLSNIALSTIGSSGGTVSVTGTGGSDAGGNNAGVVVDTEAQIISGSGTLSVTGIGGGSAGAGNSSGVIVSNGAELLSETALSLGIKSINVISTGNINVTGTEGNDPTSSVAIDLSDNGGIQTNGNVTLIGDSMNLADAGGDFAEIDGAIVTIQERTPRAIDLGDKPAGELGLTNAELQTITATTLGIGDSNAKSLSITEPLFLGSVVGTLSLNSGGDLTNGSGATITVSALDGQAGGAVDIQASIAATAGDVKLTAANQLTVSAPISTASGSGGTLTVIGDVVQNVIPTPGAGNIFLQGGSVPPPIALLGPSSGGVVYQPLTFMLGATDPFNLTGKFTYTIDWGDGSPASPDTFTFGGLSSITDTHAYVSAGAYTVTLTVTDQDGGESAPVSQMITVVATPQVQNGTLAIPGTVGDATFTLTPALPKKGIRAVYSMNVTRTDSTGTTNLGTFPASDIEIYGGPGSDDAVILNGTNYDDAFTIDNGTVTEEVAQNTQRPRFFDIGLNAITSLTIDGRGGNDSLTGPNQASTWDITGVNAGTVNATTSFSDIENLIGISGNDDFVFLHGGSIGGNLKGGIENKGVPTNYTLDYSEYGSPIKVNLGTNTATGIGGIWTNISKVVGSSSILKTEISNTLIGAATNNVWDITGTNAGTVNGLAFSNFQNLTGGSVDDLFVFLKGGSIGGNLKAGLRAKGAAQAELDYSEYGSPVTVNLGSKTATAIGGTWRNVQGFIGSGPTATLIGTNVNSTWILAGLGLDAGTVGPSAAGVIRPVSFLGFGSLTGGTGRDVFAFSAGASIAGTIDGGGGTNTLDYSLYTGGVYVNLQTLTATGTNGIANIQNVMGSAVGGDILVGDRNDNVLTEIAGNNLVIGGGGADILTGGSGEDILIAGTTVYDQNVAALDALLATWDDTTLSYSQRVAELRSGVPYTDVNGQTQVAYLGTASEVTHPTVSHLPGSGRSILNGGSSGLDWFFAVKKKDTINENNNKGEIVSPL